MSPSRKPSAPISIYVRVSRVNDRAGESFLSPKDQEERCRAMLTMRGLTAGEVFTDLDQSGGSESRPSFDRMMESIRSGESGGVVVAKLNRFSRRVKHTLAAVEEIESIGAAFLSCDPTIDTSTKDGRFMLTVFSALNEMELDALTEGWDSVVADQIERGIHPGSTVPFGYARTYREGDKLDKLVPDKAEAGLVQEAFAMRARGDGWIPIGAFLRSHSSRNWGASVVSRMIENEVYLGVAFSGKHRNPNAHEPIISRDLYNAANAKRGAKSKRGASEMRLLTGLLKCEGCGLGLTSTSSKGGQYRAFRCSPTKSGRCTCRASVSETDIETWILDRVKLALTLKPQSAEGAPEDDRAQATRNLEAATAALDELVNSDEDIPAAVFAARARKLQEDVDAAQAELDALGVAEVSKVKTYTWKEFQSASIPEQRALIASYFGPITVRRGKEPIAERVSIDATSIMGILVRDIVSA